MTTVLCCVIAIVSKRNILNMCVHWFIWRTNDILYYMQRNMFTVPILLCFVVVRCWTILPMSFKIISLVHGQLQILHDRSPASKTTLTNIAGYIHELIQNDLHEQNQTKHNDTLCILYQIYCSCALYGYIAILLSLKRKCNFVQIFITDSISASASD